MRNYKILNHKNIIIFHKKNVKFILIGIKINILFKYLAIPDQWPTLTKMFDY